MPPSEQLSPDARHVLIAVNPTAGSGKRRAQTDELVERLLKFELIAETMTDLSALRQRAIELHDQQKLRVAVGAGGDGTMHELLNHTPAGVPLAMLPLGTENLLAKYVSQGKGADRLAERIRDGYVSRLDAGRANGRLFLLVASAGFDADVARRLHETRTGNISHASYLPPIFSAIRNYEYPLMQIEAEGPEGTRRLEARWCFVFNLPPYGFGLPFIPEADGGDGMLDVCTFRRGGFWHAVRYTTCLYLRQHRRLADCEIFRTARIRVTSSDTVPYQLDGDAIDPLPLELDTVPGRLTLLVGHD